MQHVSEKIREYTEELRSISPKPSLRAESPGCPPPVEAKMGCGNPFLASLSVSWSSLSQKINDQYLVYIFIHFHLHLRVPHRNRYIYIYIYMCDEFTYVEHVYIYIDIIYLCVIMCIHTCFLVHMCTHVFFQVSNFCWHAWEQNPEKPGTPRWCHPSN